MKTGLIKSHKLFRSHPNAVRPQAAFSVRLTEWESTPERTQRFFHADLKIKNCDLRDRIYRLLLKHNLISQLSSRWTRRFAVASGRLYQNSLRLDLDKAISFG